MIRLDRFTAAAMAAAALAACSGAAPASSTTPRAPRGAALELATFTGSYDPATGALTIETEASAAANALTVLDPWADGSSASNPANTFEMRTAAVIGAATGCAGGARSYAGTIRIQSFFRNQAFEDVHAELLGVTPGAYAACNSDPAPAGASDAFGLWDYGTIGRAGGGADHADRTWHFRYETDASFSFRGRILGTLAAPVPLENGPEFDWTPTSIVVPTRTFVANPTTTVAHIVWDGTSFVDLVASVTFSRQGGSVASVTSGLDGRAYGTFPGGAYWLEDPVGAGTHASHFELGGDFTVCAKIKPGVVPPVNVIKAIFAKGNPSITYPGVRRGWALAEMFDEYAFQYRTATTPTSGENFTYVGPAAMFAGTVPPTYAYDFICGGRLGDDLWVKAHGGEERGVATTSGSFDGWAYRLTIGAYEDGSAPATDVGVYEIIVDRRAPMPNVMHELVGTAEGYQLRGWVGGRASTVRDDAATMPTYAPVDPTLNATASQRGVDGNVYVLPPFASVPVVADGSGLLPEGGLVHYLHPLAENTTTTGFCVGAEVVANPGTSWADVHGTIFSFEHGSMAVHANPLVWVGDIGWMAGVDLPAGQAGWGPGTTHVFKVCGNPVGPAAALYWDDVYATGNPTPGGVLPNLSHATSALAIGAEARSRAFGGAPTISVPPEGGPLTNARIRRVFACPSSNHLACN